MHWVKTGVYWKALLPTGEATAKANRDKLIEKGFQFKYHTHQYTAKNGNTYFYCYEYGYLPLENNWYLNCKAKRRIILNAGHSNNIAS